MHNHTYIPVYEFVISHSGTEPSNVITRFRTPVIDFTNVEKKVFMLSDHEKLNVRFNRNIHSVYRGDNNVTGIFFKTWYPRILRLRMDDHTVCIDMEDSLDVKIVKRIDIEITQDDDGISESELTQMAMDYLF